MKTKELITLKILGLGTTILYGWSFLWVSILYLYGGLYSPINESGLKKYMPFELIVIAFSLIIVGLIFYKMKGQTFWRILLQDIILITILVPLFAIILGFFENDFDPENRKLFYVGIFILTIMSINLNDWVKIRDKASHRHKI